MTDGAGVTHIIENHTFLLLINNINQLRSNFTFFFISLLNFVISYDMIN